MIYDTICSPTCDLMRQFELPPLGWDLTRPGPTCQWPLQHVLSCNPYGIDDHEPAGVDMQLIGYRGQHIGLFSEWLKIAPGLNVTAVSGVDAAHSLTSEARKRLCSCRLHIRQRTWTEASRPWSDRAAVQAWS